MNVLETWTGYRSQIKDWITEAVEHGATIEMVLLDPDSPQVKYRADALENMADVREEIKLDLKALATVLGELAQKSGYEGKLEIRLYDATPVVSMYRFDDTWIVASYLWGTDSIMGPQFEVKRGASTKPTPLAESLDEHFRNLWNKAARQIKVEKGKLVTTGREGEEKVVEELTP